MFRIQFGESGGWMVGQVLSDEVDEEQKAQQSPRPLKFDIHQEEEEEEEYWEAHVTNCTEGYLNLVAFYELNCNRSMLNKIV